MGKEYQDEEVLRELYFGENLSTYDIAEKFDVAPGTIDYWFRKYDIEARGYSQAQTLHGLTKGSGGFMTHPSGYECIMTTDGDEKTTVLLHRLLAVAKYGFDAVKQKEVHHKNGVKWDNRFDNIELLDSESHKSLHAKQQKRKDGKWSR